MSVSHRHLAHIYHHRYHHDARRRNSLHAGTAAGRINVNAPTGANDPEPNAQKPTPRLSRAPRLARRGPLRARNETAGPLRYRAYAQPRTAPAPRELKLRVGPSWIATTD